MNYAQWLPDWRLRPFIEAYWCLSGATTGQPDPIFPDGRSELIVHRRTPFVRVVNGADPERQSYGLFAGQMRAPAFFIAADEADVVGVRFTSAGAAAFLPMPQHELVDRIVDVGALQVRWLTTLVSRAREAETIAVAVNAIEGALLARLESLELGDHAVRAAASLLLGTSGRMPIDEVARRVGIGRRHLERRFRAEVGMAPKLLSRIFRFQAALESASSDLSWTDIAHAEGYADQAHMIREFRAIAGTSPTRVLTEAGELTRVFLTGTR